MKKAFIVFMCIIMSITLSACNLFVSSTGKKAFEEGKLALAAGNYNEALGYFELAQAEGDKSEDLTDLINAISIYVTALDNYNNGDYENAKTTLDSIILNDATKTMSKFVDELEVSIQNGIDSRNKIDEQISGTERLFASGDYAGVELNIKELENNTDLSEEQKNKLALLKQQLETANGKVASASKAAAKKEVVYVSDSNRESAKNAVNNFAYAYEAFVKSGKRSSDDYYSYMSAYSPSWSTAYKDQWNYFNKHNITSYYVESISYDSVTYDGNAFYVIDNETISETKNGNFVRNTTKWKYTVIKDGNSFKVTNYTQVK